MIKTLEPDKTPRKYHRWTGNDEFGHHHGLIPKDEQPCIIHLSWREHRETKIHSIGCYELDLKALLAAGYIREDGAGYVRVRFVHDNAGKIFLRIREDAPSLFVGTHLHRKDIYRQVVRQVFEEVAKDTPSTDDLRTELICDDAIGHYQLSEVGWEQKRRIDDVILHADIVEGKIWIQSDNTDLTLADLLLDAGIPREHIVLAFHPPHLRQHTEFAAD